MKKRLLVKPNYMQYYRNTKLFIAYEILNGNLRIFIFYLLDLATLHVDVKSRKYFKESTTITNLFMKHVPSASMDSHFISHCQFPLVTAGWPDLNFLDNLNLLQTRKVSISSFLLLKSPFIFA